MLLLLHRYFPEEEVDVVSIIYRLDKIRFCGQMGTLVGRVTQLKELQSVATKDILWNKIVGPLDIWLTLTVSSDFTHTVLNDFQKHLSLQI